MEAKTIGLGIQNGFCWLSGFVTRRWWKLTIDDKAVVLWLATRIGLACAVFAALRYEGLPGVGVLALAALCGYCQGFFEERRRADDRFSRFTKGAK